MDVDFPEFTPPINLQIVHDAETACEHQKQEDDQDFARLRGLPFQIPEDEGTYGPRDMLRLTCDKVEEASDGLKCCQEGLCRYSELRKAWDEGNYESEWEPDPEFEAPIDDIDQLIKNFEEDIEIWTRNLAKAVKAARNFGATVTDAGVITGNRGFDPMPTGYTDQIDWGVDAPDNKRDFTDLAPEEAERYLAQAREKIEPWQGTTDFDALPEEVPGTPTTPSSGLREPQPLDSISNCPGGVRQDLGYSLYRHEIEEMEELRAEARADLPADAMPAEDEVKNDIQSKAGHATPTTSMYSPPSL